ncbi:uncharacterized protein [Miscanthus floridulus]|uniref:uncharacterized protein n=1 Tax=Miscanthus floridulus TaxID=154761 RepID=UPI003457FD05
MEEGPVGGSSSAAVVPHRVRREPPPAPLLGGSRSPTWGQPPLQWMVAQDPTSALLSLDDHAESMEQEGLDIGISTMLGALDQARGALREIIIPTTQKAEWDRLSEEARLRADMAAQLATAQEWEAQARQDTEEAHRMFEDLSTRSKLDGEEIARLRKERDELLQRNAMANEKAGEVLKELEMEQDIRRKAESRAMALQQKVDEDIEVVRSLRADLDDAVSQRLNAENVSVKLEKELAHARRAL